MDLLEEFQNFSQQDKDTIRTKYLKDVDAKLKVVIARLDTIIANQGTIIEEIKTSRSSITGNASSNALSIIEAIKRGPVI